MGVVAVDMPFGDLVDPDALQIAKELSGIQLQNSLVYVCTTIRYAIEEDIWTDLCRAWLRLS